MKLINHLVATTILLLMTSHLWADSWLAFRNYLKPDDSGNYYVVVKSGEFASSQITYCKKAAGSKAIVAARTPAFMSTKKANVTTVQVREGDQVIWKGGIDHAPLSVVVASNGSGFIALDAYGGTGYGTVITIVSGTSGIRRTEKLSGIFTSREISQFSLSMSSIGWLDSCWYDEITREAIILAPNKLIRAIPFDGGPVRNGGVEDLARAIDSKSANRQIPALELIASMSSNKSVKRAIEIFQDKDNSVALRLRAGFYLAVQKDNRAKGFFLKVIQAPIKEKYDSDRRFAFTNAGVVLAEDALSIMLKFLHGDNRYDRSYANRFLARLGDQAIDPLMEMLADPNLPATTCSMAIISLGDISNNSVVPRMIELAAKNESSVLATAIKTAIKINNPQLTDILLALLKKGCSQDLRIAYYFTMRHHPKALAVLQLAQKRSYEDIGLAKYCIEEAIECQLDALKVKPDSLKR